jgi:hypothetical protein
MQLTDSDVKSLVDKLTLEYPETLIFVTDDLNTVEIYDRGKKRGEGSFGVLEIIQSEGKPGILCINSRKEREYVCIQFDKLGNAIEGGVFEVKYG